MTSQAHANRRVKNTPFLVHRKPQRRRALLPGVVGTLAAIAEIDDPADLVDQHERDQHHEHENGLDLP
jgi:hypothetical protein